MTQGYRIPATLMKCLRELGLTVELVRQMLSESATVTHPQGNRRFEQYVFRVLGGKVLSVGLLTPDTLLAKVPLASQAARQHYRCETCRDTGKMVAFDGGRRLEHTCPDCRPPATIGVYQIPAYREARRR